MQLVGCSLLFYILILQLFTLHAVPDVITKENYDHSLQIATKNGIIQGQRKISENGTPYLHFQGIPFAQPPINKLRFKSPLPMGRWKGVLDATIKQPGCAELQLRVLGPIVRTPGSEDCLYLNVFTPKTNVSSGNTTPVIFWIYGGAFMEGDAAVFQPDYLLEEGLVVVTFSYRLGVLGFLSTGDEASPGNVGLKDQNMALRWVKNNIEKFGGDPDRITIGGHSAGACSVMHHILAPQSRGLFSRAIAMSGDTTSLWCSQKFPRKIAFDVGLSLGIETDNSTELVERMRMEGLENLQNAFLMVIIANGINFMENGLLFAPVIEPNNKDSFITHSSIELMANGDFGKVPLMIGNTNMEFALFSNVLSFFGPVLLLWDVSPSSFPNFLGVDSMQERRVIGERIKKQYIVSNSFTSATNEELVHLFTDLLYTKPISNTVRMMCKHMPVYSYVFAYEGKYVKEYMRSLGYAIDVSTNGACHGEDLGYIWKTVDTSLPSYDVPVRRRLVKLWSNFAEHGNPTPVPDPILDNVTWPVVTNKTTIPYLKIGKHLEVHQNYRQTFIDFWDHLDEEYVPQVSNILNN